MTRYGMARKMKIKMGVGIIIKKKARGGGSTFDLPCRVRMDQLQWVRDRIRRAASREKKKGFALREKKEQKEGKKRTRKSNHDEASYFPVRCGDTAGRKV